VSDDRTRADGSGVSFDSGRTWYCGAFFDEASGVTFRCTRPYGHDGKHEAVVGDTVYTEAAP
jgi:hypothetical protein